MNRSETFLLKLNEFIQSGEAREQPKGSNRGPFVDKILANAGVGYGNPWCAAFIYAGAMETKLYKKNELPYPAAAVYSWYKFFKKLGMIFTDKTKVKRGDLAFYLNADNHGHIMAVAQVKHIGPLYYFRSEEGNSNEDGAREGWKAIKKWRLITNKYQFISFSTY